MRVLAGVIGLFFLGPGVWAMAAPASFFDALARFEPYNQHFIQDIGAFQVGLGAVLLLAATWKTADALGVAFVGVGIGSAAHSLSHVLGIGLGGTPALDIPLFVGVTVLLLAAGAVRRRRTDRSGGAV